MTKNYYRAFLIFGLGLGLFSAQAQDKQSLKPQEKSPQQSSGLIKLDQSQTKMGVNATTIFKQQLQLTDENNFITVDQKTDKKGFVHQKFKQNYKNIPVEFASPVIHEKNGTPISISGEFYAVKDLDVNPKLGNGQAFQKAISHIGASHYLWEYPDASKEIDYKRPKGELVVLPLIKDEEITLKLAYKFDIYATQPLSRGVLYIDAQNGDALFYNSIIKHVESFGHVGEIPATVRTAEEASHAFDDMVAGMYVTASAQTRYSGTQSIETALSGGNYILSDSGRKVYTRDAKNQAPGSSYPYINNYDQFTDNDNNWTTSEHSANKDNAALDAHWGAMMTRDYFSTVHGRNSYDDNAAQIRSYVHVDRNYDNAFWNGSVMSYGDGSSNGAEGNGYFDALTSIDVAAHEIGHAVCTYTADLAYQRESGGMNEGFSDIWGAAVEHFAKGNGSDLNPDPSIWLIGDEIDRRSGSAALRSMSDPKSLGQPDTYGGSYWQNPNCGTPTNNNDYCGVHTNSGVLNHWFYLVTVGGSGSNDVGDSYNVSGIGMSKAANITYRTESVYLSANSTFANARTAAIQAAIDLYGAGGPEEQAVTNAWYAVNVGAAYGGTPPSGGDYCTTKGNSVSDEYIGRVQLGSINNVSGATGGYTDYTSITTDLVKDASVSITITPTWTGTVYSEGYAVWIDYNQNQSFEDSGELVYSRAASTATSVGGSFTVPTTALEGATRMRVSMKYNGIPSSCETFSYGEVEDYTINITTGGSTGDTQAPSVPAGLTVSNITETTADISWNASTDNIGVTGYDVYEGSSLLGTVTSTSANITGLVAASTYSFSIRAKDAAGNISASSASLIVTTAGGSTGGSDELIGSYFESGWDGWSDGGSDCARYSGSRSPEGSYSIRLRDDSGTGSAMTTASTFNLTPYDNVEITFSFYSYSMENGEDFWVRYNDGSGWQTVAAYARGTSFNNNTFYTATVNLSSSQYNLSSNAQFRFQCDASGNSDYIYIDEVVITGTSGGSFTAENSLVETGSVQGFIGDFDQEGSEFEGDFTVYPNPAKQYADIKLLLDIEDQPINVKLAVYDIRGGVILKKSYNEVSNDLFAEKLDVSQLQSGVYFVEITSDNGMKETQKLIKE